MKLRAIDLIKETFRQWSADRTSELGAALAYYAVFAIAPLVIIAVKISSLVFGTRAAEGEVAKQLASATGPTIAAAIQDVIRYSQANGAGTLAMVLSLVALFGGALGLFSQLQAALNMIWGVQARTGRGWWPILRDRLLSFVVVLGCAALLFVSLISSAVLEALHNFLRVSELPGGLVLWRITNWTVSFVLVTLLFAMVYKWLPDVRMAWADVWVGAAMTSVLFTVGNYLIGLYLGHTSTTSAYGAAGSLVIILLWVYYSSQVLLFGAEFTQVYANTFGGPFICDDRAIPFSPSESSLKKKACASSSAMPSPVGRP